MKKLILLSFIFLTVFAKAQDKGLYVDAQLEKFKKSKDKSVVVGLSPSEVKAKIGNPKVVESGFPNTNDKLISEVPNLVGQMNYSTWIYIYDPIDLTLPKSSYMVNGEPVEESIYNSYLGKSIVYYVDGSLIDNDLAKDYKLTGSSRLKSKALDRDLTKAVGDGIVSIKVIPIYAVVFDKGTQVVASTTAYFMK